MAFVQWIFSGLTPCHSNAIFKISEIENIFSLDETTKSARCIIFTESNRKSAHIHLSFSPQFAKCWIFLESCHHTLCSLFVFSMLNGEAISSDVSSWITFGVKLCWGNIYNRIIFVAGLHEYEWNKMWTFLKLNDNIQTRLSILTEHNFC